MYLWHRDIDIDTSIVPLNDQAVGVGVAQIFLSQKAWEAQRDFFRGLKHRVVFLPGLRCPTVSARLPFLTLVMKAQSLPDSVIFPPTTCREEAARMSTGRYPFTNTPISESMN